MWLSIHHFWGVRSISSAQTLLAKRVSLDKIFWLLQKPARNNEEIQEKKMLWNYKFQDCTTLSLEVEGIEDKKRDGLSIYLRIFDENRCACNMKSALINWLVLDKNFDSNIIIMFLLNVATNLVIKFNHLWKGTSKYESIKIMAQ